MNVIAFDTETHLITPGVLAPKLVVGSFYTPDEGGWLMYPDDVIVELRERLKSGWYFVGANLAFDFAVVLAYTAARFPDEYDELEELIFVAHDEGRIWDVQIAEALYAVAQGHLGSNPGTGSKFERYSLDIVMQLTTGKLNAKEHDEYRLKYGELDGIPIHLWPRNAQVYPVDDVKNPYDAYLFQRARAEHTKQETNLHDLPAQCRAAWALHIGAVWGFRVDQQKVNAYEMEVTEKRNVLIQRLSEIGFVRADGSKDTKRISRAVLQAYDPEAQACGACQSTGWIADPPRFGKTGKPLKQQFSKCIKCNGLGFISTSQRVPQTPSGAVSCSRDSLYESGNDDLGLLGKLGETDKAISTYIPFLRSAGDVPLTLKPNVLLESGRTSYSGVIQLLPKKGKERQCIVARDGFVLFSIDYEGLELATHAQSCLNLFGKSRLAEVLIAGGKPHDMLAAKLYGKSNEEYAKLRAAGDPLANDLRDASKPANFGFPTGMGEVTLVKQSREENTVTIGQDGRVYHGIRFCILMRYGRVCGEKMLFKYKGRDIAPLCEACLRAARDLRQAWLLEWPENDPYFQFIDDRVNRVGYIKQHFSNRVRGRLDFTQMANTLFQGLAADGAKRALYAVVREQRRDKTSVLRGSTTIVFPHDELVGEAPIERAHLVVPRVQQIMEQEMKVVCPDVPIRTEGALMYCWDKRAKPVYDDAGRLIPWVPKETTP